MTAFPFYHQHDTMQCGGIIGDRFTSVPVPMTLVFTFWVAVLALVLVGNGGDYRGRPR